MDDWQGKSSKCVALMRMPTRSRAGLALTRMPASECMRVLIMYVVRSFKDQVYIVVMEMNTMDNGRMD